ncbi:SUMF1/EgtB/PvdO family nonheme iron enzyme [uncultured Thiodictyon sp.]|uniref:SUMF1/EgtB/PvdO family nonheme iron enzyme n=1 Tax=uncultured Thiodictyon sp. TaxID=1846217 RepID=UPI0025E17659|nr:SUMF1/EgtB/PvdO family nonheme iron enzyme [uncultured Thiodictyon sp.]
MQPLDFTQHVTPMVRQAYDCIHPRDAVARANRAQELLDRIGQLEDERRARLGPEASILVDSPLMVRLLLIVNESYRQLPDARADLFDKAIEALLRVDYGREEEDRHELATDWEDFREMAQHLAIHMHQQGRDQGREIDERALAAALREKAEFQPYIKAFIGHARQRGSVVEERDGTYRFIHLAFQEFLVARYLAEVPGRDSRQAMLDCLTDHLEDPWWREPILLLAGYLAKNAAGAARRLLGELAATGTTANARFSAAELAGAATLEWQKSGEALRTRCAQRILTLMGDAEALRDSRPPVRARAGDTLGRLGDPRFDPRRWHLPADDLLGFVRIPADPQFKIGTRSRDKKQVSQVVGYDVSDDEINDLATPTPAFYCARYPVTVAQFRAYCEAAEVRPGNANALRDADNRPVRYVDWREALAYCEWLNQALASEFLAGNEIARLVGGGSWRVALPSELEWEKAARGGLSDTVYSWGDVRDPNRANYDDAKIGDTSAVGCFPANGFGLHDMIGNVWEWTCSRYQAYPYRPGDGRESPNPSNEEWLVVRGGSWSNHRDLARGAYRGGVLPGARGLGLGFRVVLRSAPVSSAPSSVTPDSVL